MLPLIREEMWIRNFKRKKLSKVSNCVNINSLTLSVDFVDNNFFGLKKYAFDKIYVSSSMSNKKIVV